MSLRDSVRAMLAPIKFGRRTPAADVTIPEHRWDRTGGITWARTGGITTDRTDPRLGRGVDHEPVPQHDVYLVAEEREPFVRPVRRSYVHATSLGGCGAVTTMGVAIAETYAKNPTFYGSTYCVGCRMHRPVGEAGEFVWDADPTQKVGT